MVELVWYAGPLVEEKQALCDGHAPFRMDGSAVGAVHGKATAHRGSGFIDAAIHVLPIQRHAPAVLTTFHNVQAFGGIGGEVVGDVVVRLQDRREAAACRQATGTMGSARRRLLCRTLRRRLARLRARRNMLLREDGAPRTAHDTVYLSIRKALARLTGRDASKGQKDRGAFLVRPHVRP